MTSRKVGSVPKLGIHSGAMAGDVSNRACPITAVHNTAVMFIRSRQ